MDKIHIEGLQKAYASKGGRVTTLAQVNLTIRQKEFVTLPWTLEAHFHGAGDDHGFAAIPSPTTLLKR
jgi:hypothetical protein